jgi:hypothetical protein
VIASQNEASRRFSFHIGGQDNGAIIFAINRGGKSPIQHRVMRNRDHEAQEALRVPNQWR